MLPWCAEHGAAFIPFSPLGRGFLTGTLDAASFAPATSAPGSRASADEARANQAIVDTVSAVAERVDAQPAQVALAWVLAQGEHVVPIPGTRRRARLEENAGAARVTLSAADLAELDALPAPEGARY